MPSPSDDALLVQNPDSSDSTPSIVAAKDDDADRAVAGSTDDNPSAPSSSADFTLGTLQRAPPNDADPYQESDKAVANERHALDMQYQAMTKGYQDADGTVLKQVDAQMEAVHETFESYNAAGINSKALKDAIAKQDAEVKTRIERHAAGPPLLRVDEGEGEGEGVDEKKATEADDFLRRMADLDAATRRAVADSDKTIQW
jgi:hypothetical protein